MKKYITLTGFQILFLSQLATANCYLPLKYGRPDIDKKITLNTASDSEKFNEFIQKLNESPTATTKLAQGSVKIFESAGFKNTPINSIDIFPPTAATGTRHIFITSQYYLKILGQDSNGHVRSENVIETQCGTVEMDSSGHPKNLLLEGLAIESKITTSVPGATSSAGG